MTVRLLAALGQYPANAIVTFAAAVETSLVAEKLASTDLTGGVVYQAPVDAGRAGEAVRWVTDADGNPVDLLLPGVAGRGGAGAVVRAAGGSGMVNRRLGFSAAIRIPEVVFDQSPSGKYIFTQFDATYGRYIAQLSIATGALTALTKTALTATWVNNLLSSSGVALTAGGIVHAWWVSETRIIFVARNLPGNQNFLFLCNWNGSAWTVGNNSPAFDNLRAVQNLGLWSGGQMAASGPLHHKSLCIGPKILFGEYNIATGRVNGSTNDAVRVYQSDDNGATWTALLTFNTDGSTHQVRHVHAVSYDRYTGDYYVALGDFPNSAILRWDGVSAAPPANTPLSGFANYPGWELQQEPGGGVATRAGDFAITPQRVGYLSDNGEPESAERLAFLLSRDRPMRRLRVRDFYRSRGRDPLISCVVPDGSWFWGSMTGPLDTAATAVEGARGFDFWHTPDGVSYNRIAFTRANGPGDTGVLSNMFLTLDGQIVISGASGNGKGCKLLPAAESDGQGSLVMSPVEWDGAVRYLQPLA